MKSGSAATEEEEADVGGVGAGREEADDEGPRTGGGVAGTADKEGDAERVSTEGTDLKVL